jgi:hypothetical protein
LPDYAANACAQSLPERRSKHFSNFVYQIKQTFNFIGKKRAPT